jgi:hypothetical protein
MNAALKAIRLKTRSPSELPPQEELFRTCIRPGRTVELILDTDFEHDAIDVRSSNIYDIDKQGRVILAQTTPRISRLSQGQNIELTVLAQFHDVPGGQWLRVGYRTKILQLLDNVTIEGERYGAIVVVEGPQELSRFTLRLNYRIVPTSEDNLRLFLLPSKKTLPILDISAGGVKFSHPPDIPFKHRSIIRLALVAEDKVLPLNAMVVRGNEKLGGRSHALETTAVQFHQVPPETKRHLVSIIQKISRRQLAKRSGLLEEE